MDAFLAGIRDGIAGNDPAIDQAEIQTALQSLTETVNTEEAERRAADGAENAAAGEAFLTENAAKPGVVVTESGLQYEILRDGEGASPTSEDQVTIHYKGTLIDGTQFDSSYDRGEPATFGVAGVIPGFGEGLQLMTVGSQYRFFIPSDIGYGPGGSGGVIGPNATLIFEVELLEIVQ
jgi:FKBP-type peptidyl-prolyl cis-trans isomerase